MRVLLLVLLVLSSAAAPLLPLLEVVQAPLVPSFGVLLIATLGVVLHVVDRGRRATS